MVAIQESGRANKAASTSQSSRKEVHSALDATAESVSEYAAGKKEIVMIEEEESEEGKGETSGEAEG